MHLALSPALEAKLDAAEQPATESISMAAPAGSYTSKTLDLLLEVELPVAVSFGRSELPLKDVLKTHHWLDCGIEPLRRGACRDHRQQLRHRTRRGGCVGRQLRRADH